MGKNPANNGGVAQIDITPVGDKKLTKRELLELADYLYSRYEASKKPLNEGSAQTIIKTGTNCGKPSK